MNIITRTIPITSSRNRSGWTIAITKKRKYLYITAAEYLLPHDLETKLSLLLDNHYFDIEKKFGIKVSTHMIEQKIESQECALEFITYMEK